MRILFSLFVFLWAAVPDVAIAQSAAEPPFVTAAPQAILLEPKSGRVFFEKEADVPVSPASMAKLMVHAIVLDLLKAGALKEDTPFVYSRDLQKKVAALGDQAATMYIETKQQVPVIDLLRGSIILSASDATMLLATGIDQREELFISRMNNKAEELGLKNTVFVNVTGHDAPGQRMSVRDLAKLAQYIVTEHPGYLRLFAQKDFTWNKVKQPNTNPLVSSYPGADGLKTGATSEAGFGLVGTASREGRRLIMVLAGLPTEADRKTAAEQMLDWGLAKFRTIQIYSTGEKVGEARVWGGNKDFVDLVTRDAFQVTLTPAERATAEVKLNYAGPLLAPVTAGTVVGSLRVTVEGRTIAELPVMASTSVDQVTSMWDRAWDSAKIMMFGG